ncbi:MAG: NFACT family protein, partial [Candidatus Aenigmarchaeota archaeon]|nr:NFACT family protein [Candidatus Aenigmarchaeota archaeon]
YKIMIPLKAKEWRDRIIRPKVDYKYPPRSFDLEDLDFISFKHAIETTKKDQIVKSLAVILSLGGIYSEELCLRSDVDKKKDPGEITDDELKIILEKFYELLTMAKESKIEANIIYSEGKAIDVQPFQLRIYELYEKKRYPSYHEALDEFFTKKVVKEEITERESEVEKELQKQRILLEQTKTYYEELKNKAKEYRKSADLIYQHLNEIEEIVNSLLEAKDEMEWDDIFRRIEEGKRSGNKSALLIKEINPNEGTLILNLDSGIEIDFKIPVVDNANNLYEVAKKFEKKLSGVEDQIRKIESKIKILEKLKEEVPLEIRGKAPKKIVKAEKEWYEKFKWFFTSEGKLAIGGKDAIQNEILIKRYLNEDDIVFHADVYGSPFVILKRGKNASEEELRETAIFTLCHSRAWKNKRIEAVYWVYPHQVSKKAPSGEYMGRGAFMIYGKKNYIKDVELRFAIGIQLEPLKVISGPVENVRRKARYYAVIIPGDLSKDVLAKEIKNYFLNIVREKDIDYVKKLNIDEIKEHCLEGSRIFGVVL